MVSHFLRPTRSLGPICKDYGIGGRSEKGALDFIVKRVRWERDSAAERPRTGLSSSLPGNNRDGRAARGDDPWGYVRAGKDL